MLAVVFSMAVGTWASGGISLPTASAQTCEYKLGFKTLHDMIPDIVGDCIDNETHNPYNGDALQATENGLLVWRKCDNWTAFTNGATTWLNGPNGIESRPNEGPFFPWEASNCASVEVPVGPTPTIVPPVVGITQTPTPTATSTAAPGTPTATGTPEGLPDLSLDISDDSVEVGDTMTITLKASDPDGIASLIWFASDTSNNDLKDTHTFDCAGATECRKSWDISLEEADDFTIHASARDTTGAQSEEKTEEVEFREAKPTETPTETPMAMVPTQH